MTKDLVLLVGENCPQCASLKLFLKKVLGTDIQGVISQGDLTLKVLDVHKDDEAKPLVEKYDIKTIPTMVDLKNEKVLTGRISPLEVKTWLE